MSVIQRTACEIELADGVILPLKMSPDGCIVLSSVYEAIGSVNVSKTTKDKAAEVEELFPGLITPVENLNKSFSYLIPVAGLLEAKLVLFNMKQGRSLLKHLIAKGDMAFRLIESGNVAGVSAMAQHAADTRPQEWRDAMDRNRDGTLLSDQVKAATAARDQEGPALLGEVCPETIHYAAIIADAGARIAAVAYDKKRKFDDAAHAMRVVYPPGMPGVTISPDHVWYNDIHLHREKARVYFFAGLLFDLRGCCTEKEWHHADVLSRVAGGIDFEIHTDDWVQGPIGWRQPPSVPFPEAADPADLARYDHLKGLARLYFINYDVKALEKFPRRFTNPEGTSIKSKRWQATAAKYDRLRGFTQELVIDRYDPLGGSALVALPAFATYIYLFRMLQLKGAPEPEARRYVLLMLRTPLSKLPLAFFEELFGDQMVHHDLVDGLQYVAVSSEEKAFRERMADCLNTFRVIDGWVTPMAVMNEMLSPGDRYDKKDRRLAGDLAYKI